MPDKKLTDIEIVKALRSWLEEIRKSRQAYLEKVNEEHYPSRRYEYLLSDTIHEINRLQAENEKLQKFKSYFDFYYGCDIEILGIDENGNTTSFDEFYNCAIANAESIEHHIAHIIKTAKAASVKEFAERLKHKAINIGVNDSIVSTYAIDETYKELAGENNG